MNSEDEFALRISTLENKLDNLEKENKFLANSNRNLRIKIDSINLFPLVNL